jgi:hypothetical protein
LIAKKTKETHIRDFQYVFIEIRATLLQYINISFLFAIDRINISFLITKFVHRWPAFAWFPRGIAPQGSAESEGRTGTTPKLQ